MLATEETETLIQKPLKTWLSRREIHGRPAVRRRDKTALLLAIALHVGIGVLLARNLLPVLIPASPSLVVTVSMTPSLESQPRRASSSEPPPPEQVKLTPPERIEPPTPGDPKEPGHLEELLRQAPEDLSEPTMKLGRRPRIFRRSVVAGLRPKEWEKPERVVAQTEVARPTPPPTRAAFARPDPLPGKSPKPRYPKRAAEREWEGTVKVRVHIDATGQPTRVEVLVSSGRNLLDEAVTKTIMRKWRFTPAKRNGVPVASTWDQAFLFQITDA